VENAQTLCDLEPTALATEALTASDPSDIAWKAIFDSLLERTSMKATGEKNYDG
jgi:hypothetical protein